MRSIVLISAATFLMVGCADKPGDSTAILPHDEGHSDYLDRTPSDVYVHYIVPETNGSTWVRYCIMENGHIYPATRRGPIVVWTNASPMLISEYPYGGPISRIPLVECRTVKYTTGPAPHGLRRIEEPKKKADE